MRLAQVVPSLERRHGGPSVSVPALASGLAAAGNDVTLLSTGAVEDTTSGPHGLVIRRFVRNSPEFICPSGGLSRHLRAFEGDALHSHGLWLRPLHYAHQRCRAAGIPHVISPRGMMTPWAWSHNRWKKAVADRFVHPGALADADGWHATSEAEASDIRARGFQQPVCVAPNGIEIPAQENLDRAAEYWRSACPAASTRPTALFYSRFHPKKRILELIDLWLEHAPREWLLLVVGIPETYSAGQLSEYVHRTLGGNRIQVFDGTDRPPPYVAASIVVFPSHSENFGLVVAEALAHGLPVVVTDTTPWAAMQAAGHGWCVPWKDFGNAMRTALALGPDKHREIGSGARSWVLAEYSWVRTARKLQEFYASIRRR